MALRKTDNKYGLFERQTRFYESGGKWFFNTREGMAMGAYQTLADAEREFQHFLNFVNFIDREKRKAA